MSSSPLLTNSIRPLDACVLRSEERQVLSGMVERDLEARIRSANRRDADAWACVGSRPEWEAFRDPRIEALRRSLGIPPPGTGPVRQQVTRGIDAEGYRIECLAYESHPGVSVTANLYLPSPTRARMPGILIAHSHHHPRVQPELQDMGALWARQGCLVLVIDQLGYGERRWHAPGPRQDYRFRYVTGIQLQLVGESLMGWMVRDLMRGVDLLLGRRGIDREGIILMGAVAGGGDPAAVTAALDPRIACVVPFNFGGPQPESPYPLPADAEESFGYAGWGSWESTRNLRRSASEGFLPWTIVGSVAPRRLVYAHEFAWDRERDPVWRRLRKIFRFYGAEGSLSFAHGAGLLSGRPPEATHCNNIGEVHRRMIHLALRDGFGIAIPDREPEERRPAEELDAVTPDLEESLRPRPLHDLFREIGDARAADARRDLLARSGEERRRFLRRSWGALLGDVASRTPVQARTVESAAADRIPVERILLETEPGIVVPLLLLKPPRDGIRVDSLVVGLSQRGKAAFLRERPEVIAALLEAGVAVCLPDLRGTGETAIGPSLGLHGRDTRLSATELMLGGTMLGARLRDLRAAIGYLRDRPETGSDRIALWGDSFAPTNPPGFEDPLLEEGRGPHLSEPLGGLLALFGGLFEERIHAVLARGMLAGYRSVLSNRYAYLPHDAVVPGALTAGDLCDVAAALAPRPLRLDGPVDGRNCPVGQDGLERTYGPTREAYRDAPGRFRLSATPSGDAADWLVRALKAD